MPVLTATGAGVRHRRHWLFRDLDLSVDPGEIVAIVGPPGSGRTTVLLSLARRFKLSAGQVTGSASLGWVPDVTSAEPVLTVLEHVRERLLLVGRSPREAAQVALLGLDPQAKGYALSPFERQLLGLVLARLENPQVIALDRIDEGLNAAETSALWARLGEIAEEGIAVLLTAREVDPDQVTATVRLGGVPQPQEAPHHISEATTASREPVPEPQPPSHPEQQRPEPEPEPDHPQDQPAPQGKQS